MKKLILVVGLGAFFAMAPVYGQQTPLKATIDFSFTVGNTVCLAGSYEFEKVENTQNFRVKGPDHKGIMMPCITRLGGAIHTTPEDAHLVFDKVGDTLLLSEIWIPGEDGYLFLTTKGPHTHRVVNIKM